jgi:hypothetical protein
VLLRYTIVDFGRQRVLFGKRGREVLLRYTIVDFGRQMVLFGKRGKLIMVEKGGPRHSSYNSEKYHYLYGNVTPIPVAS